MKKLFTLTTLLVLALAVNAQGYRKWDFTNWSAQTIANLQEEAAQERPAPGWSDIEKVADDKAGAVAPEATAGKCFWYDSSEGGELKANGVVISELVGLDFGTSYCDNRSLAIAVDYPSTSLGEYAGPQYLWLGGGNKKAGSRLLCFTIPKVKIGQKITFVVESHKPEQGRGISLFVNDVNNDANKIGESFTPTTQDSYTWENWTLPEGVTVEGETVDILVYNTNGCHIYSIEVGDPDQKGKVGYLYNGNIESELAYPILCTNELLTIEPIEATGAQTLDALSQYDAIVISSSVNNAEAIASLKPIQPFVPVLNLNPAIYEAWGYGEQAGMTNRNATVLMPNHSLFRNLELRENDDETYTLVMGKKSGLNFQAVSPAGLFANDQVLAITYKTEADVAIHGHNLDHNGYLYIPYTQEFLAGGVDEDLLLNAISVVVGSKAKITQAPAPVIKFEYKDMNTLVTLSSGVTGAQIFYTLDGTTPTAASTAYTEPISVTTEGITVKAVVLGDGYLLSEVAEKQVDLKHQAPAPAIAVQGEAGKSTVTITSDIEGAEIYYNYTGSNKSANSSRYVAPIELTHSRTIYAFVEAEGMVASELASQAIGVQGEKVRIDILAHMDANSAEYNGGSTSTTYYFPWGKNKSGDTAYSYYDPESRSEEKSIDPETGDEVITVTYSALNPEVANDFENGWMLRSRGQIVDWENLSTGKNYGDTGGYNYASAEDENPDFPTTKSAIVLADKNTVPADGPSFPYNAYLVTTTKYAGPFDIVINVASITKPDAAAKHAVVLETSTDGNVWESNWQTVGDTINIVESARQTHNITRSYEGTEEVFVRAYLCGNNSKVGFYDIYIANAGEKSQERTGIEERKADVKAVVKDIYNLNGMRQDSMHRGLNIVRYSDGTTRKVLVK